MRPAHHVCVAVRRGKSVENKTVGLRLENPNVNFARVAEGYQVRSFGPVTEPGDLGRVLEDAVRYLKDKGEPVLVDVVSQNR